MISRDSEIKREKEIQRIRYSEKKCVRVCARSVRAHMHIMLRARDTNEVDNINKRKRVYDRKHTSQSNGYVRSQVCLTACHKA